MRNRNLIVLAVAAVLILLVAGLSLLPQQKRAVESGATVAPAQTSGPEAQETQAAPSVSPEASQAPLADAYLLVSVAGVLYEPIAIYEEGEYTVRRGEMENGIHVTPNSVTMQSSTCDNQDCVLQGTVTLENMAERVLGNMIICLPNEVTLELYTPEGLTDVLLSMEQPQ